MLNKSAKLFALTLSLTTVVQGVASVSAHSDHFEDSHELYGYSSSNSLLRNKQYFYQSQTSRSAFLPAGTEIRTTVPRAEKILVTREETAPVTLEVAEDVRDESGNIVIPRGSEIRGEIRPAGRGSRFVSDTLVLTNGEEYFIDADSRVISRTETIEEGKDNNAIWQGALAGTAAATIIAGVTGDRAIATEEVLGGAGLGALAGFLLRGSKTKELISINTDGDLDLTLTADLEF